MTKKDLAELISIEFDISKIKAETIITFLFQNITDNLSKGDKVSISGFGKFLINKRGAREGRNPATGEKIKIKASNSLKFKIAKKLKNEINKYY